MIALVIILGIVGLFVWAYRADESANRATADAAAHQRAVVATGRAGVRGADVRINGAVASAIDAPGATNSSGSDYPHVLYTFALHDVGTPVRRLILGTQGDIGVDHFTDSCTGRTQKQDAAISASDGSGGDYSVPGSDNGAYAIWDVGPIARGQTCTFTVDAYVQVLYGSAHFSLIPYTAITGDLDGNGFQNVIRVGPARSWSLTVHGAPGRDQSGYFGPTAECRDGTQSYSAHARGTCSHHNGVAHWDHYPGN